MASYEELASLRQNSALKAKVVVAILEVADDIRLENPGTPERRNWSREAFDNPEAKAEEMFDAMLIINRASNVNQIQNAPDSAIKANVLALVGHFVSTG